MRQTNARGVWMISCACYGELSGASRPSSWPILTATGSTLPPALRFLRAGKGNEEEGLKRAKETLEWRRHIKPDLITPESIKEEASTGKMWVDTLPLFFLRSMPDYVRGRKCPVRNRYRWTPRSPGDTFSGEHPAFREPDSAHDLPD